MPAYPYKKPAEFSGRIHADCYVLAIEQRQTVQIELAGPDQRSLALIGSGLDCQGLFDASQTKPNKDSQPKWRFLLPSGKPLTLSPGLYAVNVQRWIGTILVSQPYGLSIRPATGEGLGLAPPTDKAFRFAWLTSRASASTTMAAAPQAATPAAGQIIGDCPGGPDVVVLPAGSGFVGSSATEPGRGDDEGPRHAVTIARPFAIGRAEISFDQWNACVADGGCAHRPGDQGWSQGQRPVVDVSWLDAMTYVDWLSAKSGKRYFLPSEAEWEYAARAGTDSAWSTGEAIITDDANLLGRLQKTVPTGSYPPNAFGLHDMHGNVAEWVSDCHDSTGYFGAPADGGAHVPAPCVERVQRGGAWNDEPDAARSAARKPAPITSRSPTTGFRVARAL